MTSVKISASHSSWRCIQQVVEVPGIFAHVFADKAPALLARKSREPLDRDFLPREWQALVGDREGDEKSFAVAHPQLSSALRLGALVGDRQYGKLLAVGASDHCLGQIRQFDASAARLGTQGFKGMLGGETVTFHHQTSCDAHHAR